MAAPFLLTTTQRVEAWIGASDLPKVSGAPYGGTAVDHVSLHTTLHIGAVSRLIETRLARLIERVERTQAFDIRRGQHRVVVPAWPIDTVQTLTVHNSASRAFTASTLVPATDYYVNPVTGEIAFEYGLEFGVGTLQVVWTGGLAHALETPSSPVSGTIYVEQDYPELIEAASIEVAHRIRRAAQTGIRATTSGRNRTEFASPKAMVPEALDLIAHLAVPRLGVRT